MTSAISVSRFAIATMPRSSRLETEYVLTRGAQTWRQYGSQQVYTVAELARLLAANGLKVLALFSGVEAKPYALGEGELYVVAQAPTR